MLSLLNSMRKLNHMEVASRKKYNPWNLVEKICQYSYISSWFTYGITVIFAEEIKS